MGRRRLLLLCVVSGIFFICIKCLFRSRIDPTDESFTGLGSCPACYGKNLCPSLFHGDIFLIGGSKLKYFQFINRKNVYHGKLGSKRVVMKKLAHNWEIREVDRKLCNLAGMLYPCDVGMAIMRVLDSVPSAADDYLSRVFSVFNSSTDIARCPSERLLSHIYEKTLPNKPARPATSRERVAEIMYGMLVNPESVILQAFTQNEGWPFPQFIGSCGRLIVVEYVGRTLLNFEDAPWLQRLDLSYQLLQIAEQLTENALGFALYLTDVTLDNFAVRPDGTLFLIDVENVIIVDRLKIRSNRMKHWDRIYSSKGEACRDCLSFSYEDLCSHDVCDHNYYAVCKGLLVPHAYFSSRGLLHSIPPDVERKTNLSALLNECANPASDIGRYLVVPKLLQVMKSLL